MSDFSDRCVCVTGAGSGIGLAIARAFARAGAALAIHGGPDGDDGGLEASLRSAGARAVRYFRADFRDPASVDVMTGAIRNWSEIDILINNAGMQHTAGIGEMTSDTWNSILAVNLSAAFQTLSAFLPHMVATGYGRAINIASVHGLVASRYKAAYVASKFGLVGLTKVAALECAQAGSRETGGVTVNCLCPGWTETGLIEPQILTCAEAHGGDRSAGISDLLSEKQPSLRMTDVEDIAQVAIWLCAPEAHNITGVALPIDGGWTAQ